MVKRFTSYGNHVTSLLIFAVLGVAPNVHAQKLKLAVRTGASLANFTGHNDSGSSVYQIVDQTSSYYDINYVRPDGTSYANLKPYYNTSPTKDVRTGFYAGVFLEIMLKKRLSLEPGLAYVQKGIDLDYSSTIETSSMKSAYRYVRSIHTNYIAIPVVVKYYLGRKERFYVAGGIYDAFAVKTKIKEASTSKAAMYLTDGLPAYATSYSYLSEIKTRVVDCGLVGGVGFNLPVGPRFSLGVDARINVGLINVREDSSESNYLNFSSSTKNINLETGLRVAYALSAL